MSKIPRSPLLNPRFALALQEFGIAFARTAATKHSGSKGTAREEVLKNFFRDRLPQRYGVATGEVVDLRSGTSPQLDLMFYDQTVNFAFNTESNKILPAEALLAIIEVKSRLNKQELDRSAKAAAELRSLQPFGKPLAGRDVGPERKGTRFSTASSATRLICRVRIGSTGKLVESGTAVRTITFLTSFMLLVEVLLQFQTILAG